MRQVNVFLNQECLEIAAEKPQTLEIKVDGKGP